MSDSGQKFITRNRAPRVHITYDVETGGATTAVELPFVMGVMADLYGNPDRKLDPVSERKFLEIDVDNFDDRLEAMAPHASFRVDNTLTGEGDLSVKLDFKSMDDFSPAAIARQVEPLRKLLEVRDQLNALVTRMDGKPDAELEIAKLLNNPELLKTLAGTDAADDAAASTEG